MKMSPLMSSLGNDNIASSEYGMLPNVGVVAALVQGPYGVRRFGPLRAGGRPRRSLRLKDRDLRLDVIVV